MRRSLSARSLSLIASGSDESAMLKRKWMADETLLTFWPPAPCERMAVNSHSSNGMDKVRVMGSMVGKSIELGDILSPLMYPEGDLRLSLEGRGRRAAAGEGESS